MKDYEDYTDNVRLTFNNRLCGYIIIIESCETFVKKKLPRRGDAIITTRKVTAS